MHRSFAVACLVGLSAAISHAGEWSSSQLTNIEIPTVFRTSRIVPLRSVSPAIRRHLPVFVLKTSGPSNGNVVSLTEPDDPSESDFEDSKFAENDSGFIRVPQGEPLPEYQPESTYPPVNPLPRPTPFEAVPLDGATFEDEIAIEESSKKRPADGRSSLGWIAGQNDQLGMVELDFESLSQLQYDPTRADQTFLDLTFGAKWLNGPNITDLPPQLFNILINIGQSFEVNDRLRVDAMLSPGWYTDFSNKGVEAFRLPWHLVSYYRMDSDWYWVMGVTDLSRRDIRYLPVVGAVYAPSGGNVRLDLVFPKPKIAYRVRENSLRDGIWLTMSGELGGGSWAISREDRAYDVVTLRDYRLLAGVESRGVKGQATRLEAGWIFDRSVEYQSGIGNYNPTDSFIIRVSADY